MSMHPPSKPVNNAKFLLVLTLVTAILMGALPWRDTLSDLVTIWLRSDTFMHCFLVLPVALFMLYEKTQRVPLPDLAPAPVGLVAFAGFGLVWVAAQAVSVAVVAQLAVVASLVSLVFSLLGLRFVRYAAYPLAFLFLAVPFGEGLIPVLIDLTTEFVVAGLRAIGIPVYREENALMLPTGNWSVVTACSGIRYLLATITVGTVYAYLNINSGLRRTAFLVAAVLVALVGNWMRALGIVLLGHFSGNRLAVGADHLIYGWVFFGFLVFFLIAIGEIFFAQRSVSRVAVKPAGDTRQAYVADAPNGRPQHQGGRGVPSDRRRMLWVMLGIGAIAGVEGLFGARLTPSAGMPGALTEDPPAPAGYRLEAIGAPAWQPDFEAGPAPQAFRLTSIANPKNVLELLVYVWSEQGPGMEASASVNVVAAGSNEIWKLVGASARPRALGHAAGKHYAASLIRSRSGSERRVGVAWFTLSGFAENPLAMKLAELRSRLINGRAPAWGVVISQQNGGEGEAAWTAIDAAMTAFVDTARVQGWPTLRAQRAAADMRVPHAEDAQALVGAGAPRHGP